MHADDILSVVMPFAMIITVAVLIFFYKIVKLIVENKYRSQHGHEPKMDKHAHGRQKHAPPPPENTGPTLNTLVARAEQLQQRVRNLEDIITSEAKK